MSNAANQQLRERERESLKSKRLKGDGQRERERKVVDGRRSRGLAFPSFSYLVFVGLRGLAVVHGGSRVLFMSHG